MTIATNLLLHSNPSMYNVFTFRFWRTTLQVRAYIIPVSIHPSSVRGPTYVKVFAPSAVMHVVRWITQSTSPKMKPLALIFEISIQEF